MIVLVSQAERVAGYREAGSRRVKAYIEPQECSASKAKEWSRGETGRNGFDDAGSC